MDPAPVASFVNGTDSRAKTDEQLVEEAQTGDQLSYTTLVNRYWQRLVGYVRKLLPGSSDAEDIVQEAFVKAYVNLRSFNPDRRFSPWIYRITHNTLVDHVKTLKRQPLPFFDPDVLFPHPVAPDNPHEEVEIASVRKVLGEHFNELDPRYREPLILRYYEHLSYRDIAEVLRIPIGTVSIRIKRGLEKLRERLPNDLI
ncbi:MAG: RNA polymerase sigma factor [Candidatus Kerfeldbacteria bacterium]|nr:RNA polymerase sigma factor [Candidatus Kerfeldbacteria bacterium]